MKSFKRLVASLVACVLIMTSQPSIMTFAASQKPLSGEFGTFHSCSMTEEELKEGDYYSICSGDEFWHTEAGKELSGGVLHAVGQTTEDTGLYRDQLTGMAAKLYDGIVSAGGVSGSRNAVTVTYTVGANEDAYDIIDEVDECFARSLYAYEYDHLDEMYFQVANGVGYSLTGTTEELEIVCSFLKADYYTSSLESQAKSKLSQGVSKSNQQNHIEDRLRALNQWVCDNCTYDYDALEETSYETEKSYYAHSALGLLIKNTGVCESYAKVVKLACMQLGIKCVLVTSETHAFNYIKMDDGKWYMLDCTWNDGYDDSDFYEDYFLISNSPAIDSDHKESSELTAPKTASSKYVRTETQHTHTVVTDPAVAATCTQPGKTEGSHCSTCGEVIKAQETIAALGHSYDNGKVTKEATCVAKGIKTFTCTRCSATKTEEIAINSNNHTGATVVKNKKEATKTEEGYTGDTCCADCGAILQKGTVIAKLPSEHTHTIVIDEAVDPTCVYAGKTQGKHCSTCGEVIVAQKTIPALGHDVKNVIVYEATLEDDGLLIERCSRCYEIFDETNISHPEIFELSKSTYTYDGKTHKPSVSVYDCEGEEISPSNYSVTYASSSKSVGKYKVTITFNGMYSGSRTLTYKINPVKTSITSVQKGKKSFTMKWKKKTTQVTGYEIQYSTSKKFSSGTKSIKITKPKTTSLRVKGLKVKKKYYLRIRTYRTVNKVKYYSGWSAVKNVTTK